jgi:hypothetical protein
MNFQLKNTILDEFSTEKTVPPPPHPTPTAPATPLPSPISERLEKGSFMQQLRKSSISEFASNPSRFVSNHRGEEEAAKNASGNNSVALPAHHKSSSSSSTSE